MGPLASLLILPPAVWGWWRARRHFSPDAAALALGVALSWLLLTVLAQANARNLVALLPSIVILLVVALRALPRPLPAVQGALWLVVLGLQWSLYTFDALHPLHQRSARLWVYGDYNAFPASGASDPGYWIHTEVLDSVVSEADEPATLAMLIDTWEIHRGAFRYLITLGDLPVEITPLTESTSRGWSDLLANEWLLAKSGDNSQVKEPGQELLRRLESQDPLLDRLYRPERTWTLPNGDTVTLYHRSEGPPRPLDFPVVLIETAPVAEALAAAASPNATLYATDADVATWVLIHGAPEIRTIIPTEADQPAAEALKDVTGTLLALSRYRTPEVSALLYDTAYVASESSSGEFSLTIAGRPAEALQPEVLEEREPWAGCVVAALATLPAAQPGDVLPVQISAAAGSCESNTLKFSVRLLDGGENVIAQRDVQAAPDQRLGLLVPPNAQPGTYSLAVLLYNPVSLSPIPSKTGVELAQLATVSVGE